MSNILGTVRKAGNRTTRCCLNAQYAKQLAFIEACAEMGWNVTRAARELQLSTNAIKRWVSGDREVSDSLLDVHPEFAAKFWERHRIQRSALAERAA